MKTLVAMPRVHLENACHQHKSFNFDWIFLKLADKVDMDKLSDNLEK